MVGAGVEPEAVDEAAAGSAEDETKTLVRPGADVAGGGTEEAPRGDAEADDEPEATDGAAAGPEADKVGVVVGSGDVAGGCAEDAAGGDAAAEVEADVKPLVATDAVPKCAVAIPLARCCSAACLSTLVPSLRFTRKNKIF